MDFNGVAEAVDRPLEGETRAYTQEEVAERLGGVTKRHVENLIADGLLHACPTYTLARKTNRAVIRVTDWELRRYMRQMEKEEIERREKRNGY